MTIDGQHDWRPHGNRCAGAWEKLLVGTPFMVTGVLEMVVTDALEKIAASIPFMGTASITDYQRRGCKTG